MTNSTMHMTVQAARGFVPARILLAGARVS
jgi:hypothetical protein